MPFDQSTRNRLAAFVSTTRALLAAEFTRQLQQEYGLDPSTGIVTELEKLTYLDDARRETARVLRATLEHYLDGKADAPAKTRQEALDRIVREQAFTVLNRLCALRMAETRGLLIQSVGRGHSSKGFQLYSRLAGAALGETGDAYRHYLQSVFDELAVDLPVLFDRWSKEGRLFPREAALQSVLEQVNHPEIDPLWAEDETIGWIYQYFNSKEERKAMRDASQAPRNSRELAVRNQFFTPRYVVEFLTDNTLGRTWYEMRCGETRLVEQCRYMVRRKHPVFLDPMQDPPRPWQPADGHEGPDGVGELWTRPDLEIAERHLLDQYALTIGYGYRATESSLDFKEAYQQVVEHHKQTGKWEGSFEELRMALFFWQRRTRHMEDYAEEEAQAFRDVYQAICRQWDLETEFIPYRAPKDPRDLKILDPACGSGHFLLYAFDLLTTIYEEAWEWEGAMPSELTGATLRADYSDMESLRRAVPALILAHNLHGIDIDQRACQIAGLALWLRAQREYQNQSVRTVDRPAVNRGNIVCAAPMPGERDHFSLFLSALESPTLARLTAAMWDELLLAGIAGSLLKPEARLRAIVSEERKRYTTQSKGVQQAMFLEQLKGIQHQFDYSDVTDERFWDAAEEQILFALQKYGDSAEKRETVVRRFFASDGVQGFQFVNIMRQRYDIILMNPPFGDFVPSLKGVAQQLYPNTYTDFFAAFTDRSQELLCPQGLMGAITSRVGFFLTSFRRWREQVLLSSMPLIVSADLGGQVMDDAMVESAAYVLKSSPNHHNALFIRLLGLESRPDALRTALVDLVEAHWSEIIFFGNPEAFKSLPDAPFAYWVSHYLLQSLGKHPRLEPTIAEIRTGLQTGDDPRFVRAIWEVPACNFTPMGTGRNEFTYWVPHVKSGASQPWYSPLTVAINWKDSGYELRNYVDTKGKPKSVIRNENYYFRPGFSWTRRAVRFIPYAVPAGCIPTVSRYMGYPRSSYEYEVLGIIASNIVTAFLRFYGEWFQRPNYLTETVRIIPFPESSPRLRQALDAFARAQVTARRKAYQLYEPFHDFVSIALNHGTETGEPLSYDMQTLLGTGLEQMVAHAYGLSMDQQRALERDMREAVSSRSPGADVVESADESDREFVLPSDQHSHYAALISYVVGAVLGRWDVRIAKHPQWASEVGGIFDAIPICSPGMLTEDAAMVGVHGPLPYRPARMPAKPTHLPANFPIDIAWSGILVEDIQQPTTDITRKLQIALGYMYENQADAVEIEACSVLRASSLREYVHRPSLFFAQHLAVYTKSRRQAPIYWPLSTPSVSYTLWLYYHRLTDQTLFTCVNDFVDPKLKQVATDISQLQQKPGRSSADEKELERFSDLLRELQYFRAELLRLAAFWKPNLNDGVEITAAPLWKLFQHKPWRNRLKATWEKLEAGEYDWAHLAYSIWPERVSEKCRTDKSLAIAHELEHLYEEPKTQPKKGRGSAKRQSAVLREEPLDDD